MGTDIYWLITILNGDELLRCALQVTAVRDNLSEDVKRYPMEPENREIIRRLLPEHLQDVGPIVQVEELFSIEVV